MSDDFDKLGCYFSGCHRSPVTYKQVAVKLKNERYEPVYKPVCTHHHEFITYGMNYEDYRKIEELKYKKLNDVYSTNICLKFFLIAFFTIFLATWSLTHWYQP